MKYIIQTSEYTTPSGYIKVTFGCSSKAFKNNRALNIFMTEGCDIFSPNWIVNLRSLLLVLNGVGRRFGIGGNSSSGTAMKDNTEIFHINAVVIPEELDLNPDFKIEIPTIELKDLLINWLDLQADFYIKKGLEEKIYVKDGIENSNKYIKVKNWEQIALEAVGEAVDLDKSISV